MFVISHLKSSHGIPEVVVSDDSAWYTSAVFEKILKRVQANGKAERAVKGTSGKKQRSLSGVVSILFNPSGESLQPIRIAHGKKVENNSTYCS